MNTNYHKRRLPHIQCDGMINFVTFRTHDSVDGYVNNLNLLNIDTKTKQYQIDRYLDNSKNGAYLYDEQLKIIKDILFEYDNILYELYSFAIMPNHVHILIMPKDSLNSIMKKVKGKSAKLLNDSLKREGKFWAREYYDKVIRDERQLKITMKYVLNNPIKADLDDCKDRVYSKFEDTD